MNCLLALLMLCHPNKFQFGLNTTAVTLTMVDAWVTQRNFALPEHYEENPLARPFVSHGPTLAYASSTIEMLSMAYLGARMKRSHNWTRRIWWLPQAAEIGGHAWGLETSLRGYRP